MALKYFDTQYYLQMNNDVKQAITNGQFANAEDHYLKHGEREGRNPNAFFNVNYYLSQNSDVKTAFTKNANFSAYQHFLDSGQTELRNPNPMIDLSFYLQKNSDIGAAVYRNEVKPFDHLMTTGQYEMRITTPYFTPVSYTKASTQGDVSPLIQVKAISALEHFIRYGVAENRNWGNGVKYSDFVQDTTFSQAIFTKDVGTALARVAAVEPFLPTFQPSVGDYVAPSDLSIPLDFTPATGTKLRVPDSVTVSSGTTLPSTFETVVKSVTLSASTPADNATSINPADNIVLTFSENIQAGSGNITLVKGSAVSTGTTTTTTTTSTSSTTSTNTVINIADSSQVSISQNKLIINPTNDLESITNYSVKIDASAIKSATSTSRTFAGISDTTTLNFSTSGFSKTISNGILSLVGDATSTVYVNLVSNTVNGSSLGTTSLITKVDASKLNKYGINVTGTANADLFTGTSTNDSLYGGDGADTLIGGTGADDLTGQGGADRFVLNQQTLGHLKTIQDFSRSAGDKIQIVPTSFTTGSPFTATTDTNFFKTVSSETNLTGGSINTCIDNAAFIYVQNTKYLYYNNDGAVSGGLIPVAQVVGVTDLAATDFVIEALSTTTK